MKKHSQPMLGVTLLEIMLVLAIAAMVIVMSVRYYQSAQASQQANTVIQQLTAVTTSADSLSQGSGSYSAVNSTNVGGLLSNVGGLVTPWGENITLKGGSTTYTVTVTKTPASVCGIVWGQLNGNPHVSGLSACNASGTTDLTYTYNMQVVTTGT